MVWFKRMAFFSLVNIAIVVMVSVILNVLGIQPYLDANGINYSSLMIFCLLWGTGGAFVSLWMSKWMAKKIYGVQIQDSSGRYGELVQMVHNLARTANLPKTPEVGIYDSPEINAFATGPSKSNSLVAVSTGLLQKMDRAELEGVLGHEVAHISNGDMVTMTLIQGVINAFVMFLARIVASLIDNFMSGDEEGGGLGFFGYMATIFALEMVFGLLGSMVTAYFSRIREFRADAGCAKMIGREKMIRALESLQKDYGVTAQQQATPMAAMQISSKGKLLQLLSTHPPLEKRIAALRSAY